MEARLSDSLRAPAGIMYSATGEQHVNEALVGARSSLRHNDVPHVLFASPVPEDEVPPGLTVVPFEPEPSGDWFLDAIANMRRSPFERTIFLDTDTYVVGEIVHMLRVLDQYDIAAAHEVGHRPFHDPEVPPIFHEFNTGVIAWRAGELTTMFLDSWHETRREWTRAEPFRQAATGDQRAFRCCAWKHGLRAWVLRSEYNYRLPHPGLVTGSVRVIHGRYHDYEGLARMLNRDRGPRSFVPQMRAARPVYPKLGGPGGAVPEVSPVWPNGVRHAFVGGFVRSGVSAVSFLLNEHPQVVLGYERFGRLSGLVDPAFCAPEIFCSPTWAETDVCPQSWYDGLREKLEAGEARVIGDECPSYARELPSLVRRFPEARFVITFRELEDVAGAARGGRTLTVDDARRAVRKYNETLRMVRDAAEAGVRNQLFILPFARFYGGEDGWLGALLEFLGLWPAPALRGYHRALVMEAAQGATEDVELEDGAREILEDGVDRGALRWWRAQIEEPIGGSGPAEQPPELPGLAQLDIARWRAQREEVIGATHPHPVAGDNGATEPQVRRRLQDLSRALNMRTERLLALEREHSIHSGRPAVEPAPVSKRRRSRLRITFVLAHQVDTTDAIYAIQRYAGLLARTMSVHLAVQDVTPTPLRGTTAGWALDECDLPAADVLVAPAEIRDEWLLGAPPTKGRLVLYLQGFGAPMESRGALNLERIGDSWTPTEVGKDPCPNVIAVSRWLAEDAAQCGCRVVRVPYGLDRGVFAPSSDPGERRPLVAMMTHDAAWKGTDDGLQALAGVRARRPDVEVVLFGAKRAEFAAEFHHAPDRARVAEILKRASVYVEPSWEEGFGMIGVEALACGASLASTDTKGSRDYAEHDRTALVSPPRDPEALADNVLRLLDDASLRSRLLTEADSLLEERMPSWETSAELFAAALSGEAHKDE